MHVGQPVNCGGQGEDRVDQSAIAYRRSVLGVKQPTEVLLR